MNDFLDSLSNLAGVPPEQWLGVIALTGLLLAFFALYVVLTVIRDRKND